jgi:hypothetical protein
METIHEHEIEAARLRIYGGEEFTAAELAIARQCGVSLASLRRAKSGRPTREYIEEARGRTA